MVVYSIIKNVLCSHWLDVVSFTSFTATLHGIMYFQPSARTSEDLLISILGLAHFHLFLFMNSFSNSLFEKALKDWHFSTGNSFLLATKHQYFVEWVMAQVTHSPNWTRLESRFVMIFLPSECWNGVIPFQLYLDLNGINLPFPYSFPHVYHLFS